MIGNPKILSLDEYHRVVEAKLGSKDFKIVSLEEAPFEQRVGFLADHARVHVGVELPGGRREKLTFFAKGLPANENCRALVEENGSFEKEMFFYEVLAKHFDRVPLSARTYPTCYLLKPGVFVLEDLGALGFKPVKSNLDPVDLDHCHQFLAALARFHCASIVTEENLHKTLRDAYPEHMFESFFVKEGRTAAWWRSGLEAARALLPLLPQYKDDPAAVQRLQDRIRGLGATLLRFFEIDTRRRNVFCHGDAWISNVLFTYQQEKPDKAMLLDFQLMRYAPPVYDVQLFLHKSLPYTDDRSRQMALLLRFYYDRLQDEVRAAGLDPDAVLPEAEFLETSREAARMATIVVVLYSQVCDMPADFIEKLFSDDVFYNAYVCGESRVEHVTDVFHTDKHFRWVFQNALGNLAKMLEEENK